MAVLNLRKVPEDLMRELRKAAIDAGEPFHEHCVRLLELAVGRSMPPGWRQQEAIESRAETLLRGGQRSGGMCDLPPAHAPQASDMDFAPDGGRPQRRDPLPSAVKVDIT